MSIRRSSRLSVLSAAAFLTLAADPPAPALAFPVSATPSLSLEQGYDSNIFDSRNGNEVEDYFLRIRPAISDTTAGASPFSTKVFRAPMIISSKS